MHQSLKKVTNPRLPKLLDGLGELRKSGGTLWPCRRHSEEIFFWKWHRILFMAEKGKYKTTIVAVCYRCSRSRLGTCVRKGDFVCVAGTPPPPSPSPPLHFHFLLPLKSKLWLTCYLRRCFSLLPKRSPQSQVPGRAKSHLPTMQISCFELPQTIRRPRRLPVGTKTNRISGDLYLSY